MAKWKKCPNCAKIYPYESTLCENCGQRLQPLNLRTGPRTAKPKKPRKEVQYVRLSHGRVMKKSTYDWIQKRDAGINGLIWLFFGVSIFAVLIKGCN